MCLSWFCCTAGSAAADGGGRGGAGAAPGTTQRNSANGRFGLPLSSRDLLTISCTHLSSTMSGL
jgi:hypothetical protein